MQSNLSKTNFLDFLFCSKNLWLKLHKPDLLSKFALSDYEQHLADEGNEVEAVARALFPGGIEVRQYGQEACNETTKLLTGKVPAIFQATFITEGFLARSDVLKYDAASDSWYLYEIKGTSSVHESGGNRNHLDDLAFQQSVLMRAGVKVTKTFVVHLNGDYVRQGELSIDQLFTTEEVTDKVLARLAIVEIQMETALDYLAKNEEPIGGCECINRGRSNHCTTFQYSNPHVPLYSVHDLSRIGASKKKLLWLVENNIFDLHDIPQEGVELSDIQTNQVKVHTRGTSIINVEGIQEELAPLTFPLYFLDYETFAPAIPLFNGYGSFDKVPFQFSLHILRKLGEEPEHIEYLHMEQSDPTEAVLKLLVEHILPEGTIIAWNKSFEMDVHRRMANRMPEYSAVIERMNGMFYDLKDVFHKQHYVHPEFKGSTSIKYVLPALVPSLQYKELSIHGGAQASDAWWTMLGSSDQFEKDTIAKDLKTYCCLDTYAMYAIWKHLNDLIY
jgi:hypothetical protein